MEGNGEVKKNILRNRVLLLGGHLRSLWSGPVTLRLSDGGNLHKGAAALLSPCLTDSLRRELLQRTETSVWGYLSDESFLQSRCGRDHDPEQSR